jgi:hypothetical protein
MYHSSAQWRVTLMKDEFFFDLCYNFQRINEFIEVFKTRGYIKHMILINRTHVYIMVLIGWIKYRIPSPVKLAPKKGQTCN